MTCLREMVFALVCTLPRPDAHEPQTFQHGRSTNRAELPQMFLPPLPMVGPVRVWRPDIEPEVRTASASTDKPKRTRGKRGEGYKHVEAAARKFGVPVDLALRVAKQESGGHCGLTSSAGARGVMQVMPGTARKHGVRNASNLYDCKTGAETGVRELKYLLAYTGGDVRRTLIGYNCGPGCLKRKTLPRETVNYIAAVGTHTGKSKGRQKITLAVRVKSPRNQ